MGVKGYDSFGAHDIIQIIKSCVSRIKLAVKCAPYYPSCTDYPKYQSKNSSNDVADKEIAHVGSINSNKYNRPSCIWAHKIKSENLIGFKSKKDTEKYGYVPCKVCKP